MHEAESETAPQDDLERLRHLLLGEERGAIDEAAARIAKLERAQRDLPLRLPGAIEDAQRGPGAARVAEALAEPVTRALGSAVREHRQLIVDVLFPVIGPAIRKAIAEALRTLVADLNGAIESSLTPRGLRWRIEAWRSGVPYAQIVLKHRLNYRIDHVFLIARESGLVLARESAPELPDLDADAIAGMLTAIGDFVRDSVGEGGGGTLDAARVGEHVLWVLPGPRANLACFIRGVPPASLHALLEQRLEDIHARLGTVVDANLPDPAWGALLRPERLAEDARAADPPARGASRLPLLAVVLAFVLGAGWLLVRTASQRADIEALRARLAAHPGFVLTALDVGGGVAHVRGLLDPDAEPLQVAPANGRLRVDVETAGYVSSDDAIVARRARRLLGTPDAVTVDVRNGALAIGGRAPREWIGHARERAAWIAGVRDVRFDVAASDDPAAAAKAELDALVRAIEARRVAFLRDAELAPGSDVELDALARDAMRASGLANTAGLAVGFVAVGTNDDPGGSEINARMRAMRARWLADELGKRGLADVAIAGDEDAGASAERTRGAYLRAIVGERAR